MIINLLLPLLASSAVFAIRFNGTLPARECTTPNDHTANATNEQLVLPRCAHNTPSDLGTGKTGRTIKGRYFPPEQITYARAGVIERRLMRTVRPLEERASQPLQKPEPTPTSIPTTITKTKIKTRTKTTRSIAPVEERSFLPVEGVPTYTIKPKPTVKTGIEARETPAIGPISIRPGDDKPTETHAPTTLTKTRTRTRTARTIVSIQARSLRPIEDMPTFTIKPVSTKTKTKKGTGMSTLVPIEEGTI